MLIGPLELANSKLLINIPPTFLFMFKSNLCGLTGSALDHISLNSNLGMGISEGCFIFDFASLPLEVAWTI